MPDLDYELACLLDPSLPRFYAPALCRVLPTEAASCSLIGDLELTDDERLGREWPGG